MLEERLRVLLADTATLKLATAGGAVSPWLAAAFFAEADLFTLRLMIERQGKTLANVHADPRVAVMIETGNPMALFVQGEGRAWQVDGDGREFRDALVDKTPASEPLVRLPNLVPVRIEIARWLLTDVPAGWLPAKELRAPPARVRQEQPVAHVA